MARGRGPPRTAWADCQIGVYAFRARADAPMTDRTEVRVFAIPRPGDWAQAPSDDPVDRVCGAVALAWDAAEFEQGVAELRRRTSGRDRPPEVRRFARLWVQDLVVDFDAGRDQVRAARPTVLDAMRVARDLLCLQVENENVASALVPCVAPSAMVPEVTEEHFALGAGIRGVAVSGGDARWIELRVRPAARGFREELAEVWARRLRNMRVFGPAEGLESGLAV